MDVLGTHLKGKNLSRKMPSSSLPLLYAAMILSGFGTVFLGPVLPVLAATAGATDRESGLFFTAQFLGAFLGGITTSRRLWLCLLRGALAAAAGFAALAACTHFHAPLLWSSVACFPLGFGVGQMLTSSNMLRSQSARTERGAALALLNFAWSAGAVTAPFLLGLLLPVASLTSVFSVVFACFVAVAIATWIHADQASRDDSTLEAKRHEGRGLPKPALFYFCSLLLLYGGAETSLSGWITTFGTRYGSGTLAGSAVGATALWIGITAGRALVPVLLRLARERTLLLLSLGSACLLTLALSRGSGGGFIIALAGLLGLSLAPWFPLVLSSLLGEGAQPRQAGLIIAVSGIGAAILPLLVGALSRASGSLRIALLAPFSGLLLLLLLGIVRRPRPVDVHTQPAAAEGV